MNDLSDLYSFGPGRRAQDTFTDRVPESVAFAATLARHHADVRAGLAEIDLPRRNVAVFHGIGGIGKTELARRLQRWVTGSLPSSDPWGPEPSPTPGIVSRLDCAGSEALRLDNLLIDLRTGAAEASIETSAFDLGLLSYWRLANPTTPLAFTRSGKRGWIDAEAQVVDSVTSTLGSLGLPFGTAGLTVRLVKGVIDRLRDRSVRSRVASCDRLAPTLESLVVDPYGAAPYLAGLLHWDIVNTGAEVPAWVVFVDAFEHVAGRRHRDSERPLQTLVYLLPRLLFVVAGRDRLDWADDALVGTLDHVGSTIWPGLADRPAESDQHLVGFLSDDDADDYLQRELRHDDRSSVLEESSRNVIVRAAGGLPLYLDLSVTIAADRLRRREPITPEVFGGPLGEVVRQVVKDMPPGVRQALRAAAMFRGFDGGLISAVGDVTAGDAERLAAHGIVSEQGDPPLRLRVHEAVRASILRTDSEQIDGWSATDWHVAAERGLHHLRARIEGIPSVDDRITYVSVALRLAADFGIEADWLRVLGFRLPLRRLAPRLGTPPPEPTSWADWLHCYLAGWNLPPTQNLERFAHLRWIREQENAPPKIRFSATRHLAYGLRGRGDKAAALPLIEELLRTDNSNQQLHRYQLGITYRDLNRFDAAAEIARDLEDDEANIYGSRLQASLDFAHGKLAAAGAGYRSRADQLDRRGDARVGLEQRIAALFIQALSEPEIAPALDVLQQQAELDVAPSGISHALGVKILCCLGDEGAVASLSREQARWAELFDTDPHGVYLVVPACFHRAVLEDRDGLAEQLRRFEISRRRPFAFWFDILAGLLDDLGGEPPPRLGAEPRWLKPQEVVLDRWRAVVQQRKVGLR